mmetsp:Transcript_4265/g.16079  ORF Transcript_4265/g.16079 Transcript_4265/m.16079 type:complete len:201 (+) Transcript_4265:2208-2810(+)
MLHVPHCTRKPPFFEAPPTSSSAFSLASYSSRFIRRSTSLRSLSMLRSSSRSFWERCCSSLSCASFNPGGATYMKSIESCFAMAPIDERMFTAFLVATSFFLLLRPLRDFFFPVIDAVVVVVVVFVVAFASIDAVFCPTSCMYAFLSFSRFCTCFLRHSFSRSNWRFSSSSAISCLYCFAYCSCCFLALTYSCSAFIFFS